MRFAQLGVVALLIAMCSGCSSSSVEVVDLNSVLDIFATTLTELDATAEDKTEKGVAEVKPEDEREEDRQKFLDKYTTNLNNAKLIKSAIAVQMTEAGDVEGFTDANTNKKVDTGEKKLFTVMVDPENSRLIASDDANHYRDRAYRPRMGGFFTGYLIGSMIGRNRSYYRGPRASARPKYNSMKMSPKNYHASAVSKAKAKARASSARSRSGSRGRSFGK